MGRTRVPRTLYGKIIHKKKTQKNKLQKPERGKEMKLKNTLLDIGGYYTNEELEEYREVYHDFYGAEAEELGYESELTDEKLYNFIYELERENFEYVEDMLYHHLVDDIIVFADLGLWRGRVKGYKEMSNQLNEILTIFQGDMYSLGLDNYNLVAKDCHHDGTNYYTFRQWKPEVPEETREKFLDEVYENKLTEKEFKRKLTRYTKSLKDIVTKLSGF